jgi:hypothetical protein
LNAFIKKTLVAGLLLMITACANYYPRQSVYYPNSGGYVSEYSVRQQNYYGTPGYYYNNWKYDNSSDHWHHLYPFAPQRHHDGQRYEHQHQHFRVERPEYPYQQRHGNYHIEKPEHQHQNSHEHYQVEKPENHHQLNPENHHVAINHNQVNDHDHNDGTSWQNRPKPNLSYTRNPQQDRSRNQHHDNNQPGSGNTKLVQNVHVYLNKGKDHR